MKRMQQRVKATGAKIPASAKPGARSQTVARALAVLRTFGRERRELGITEIAEELSLPKTIVFRLVQTLREHEFLERSADSAKYRIGFGAFEVGTLFKSSTLEAEAAPFMRRLVDETGHTAQLAVLHRTEMVIVARMEGRGPLKYGVSVGERRALHCSAVGKAALMLLGDEAITTARGGAGLKKLTPHTITDMRRLNDDVTRSRARGYSINWQENMMGVASVAAPVPAQQINTVAALALAFPANQSARKHLAKIGKLVSAAAADLSARV
jgi:DNA-binding IclR family transcriptional regulator